MTTSKRLDKIRAMALKFIDENDLEDGWYLLADGTELFVWERNGVVKYDLYITNAEDGEIDICNVKIATMQDYPRLIR